MTKRQYKRCVRLNRFYALKYFLWENIGWRLSLNEPKFPPCIPRKPRPDEREKDAETWSGYYTWVEMRDLVIPAFEKE